MNITIAFQNKNGGRYSKLIQWWTRSDLFHVELIINDMWITSLPGIGVVRRHSRTIDNKDDFIYVTVPTTVTTCQLVIIDRWIKDKIGRKYDTAGIILSQILSTRYEDPDRWFCSELVTKLLQLFLTEPVLDAMPNLTAPSDLFDIYTKYISDNNIPGVTHEQL